jgi:hypothetical protein
MTMIKFLKRKRFKENIEKEFKRKMSKSGLWNECDYSNNEYCSFLENKVLNIMCAIENKNKK